MAFRAGRFSANARLEQASNNNPALKQGEKGEAVAIVQQALVDLGFAMPNSTNLGRGLTDGIFGTETARVVRQFQTINSLVVDGNLGRNSLARLDALIVAQSALKQSLSSLFARNEFGLKTAKPVA